MAHFISELNNFDNSQTIVIDEKLHERLVRRSAKQNIRGFFHFDKAQKHYQLPSLFQCLCTRVNWCKMNGLCTSSAAGGGWPGYDGSRAAHMFVEK